MAAEQLGLFDDHPLVKAVALPTPRLDTLLSPDQIYESDDPNLFLRLGEDERFDRKSVKTEAKGLGPIISAFSNGPSVRGGVFAFGISNKSPTFEGCCNLSQERLAAIEAAAHIHCPDAKIRCKRVAITIDGKADFIILFRVNYHHDRLVCLTNGNAYERISDRSVEMNDGRKQQVRVDKGERQFETEVASVPYPSSFDQNAVNAFCEQLRISRGTLAEHGPSHLLESMRLGSHTEGVFVPNNACVLLFAKDPRWAFPGAIVHFLKYRGKQELSGKAYNVEKDRVVDGRIGSLIKEAASIIDANIRDFTVWNGSSFQTVREYPRDAWYELLVNACVHRSYMSRTMPIFIKMFDDRLEFQSPGGLMPGVTPQNIYERHHPRNRIIMDALRETGEVRCINEGTKRVRIEMARMRLPPPVFREEPGEGAMLRAILYNDVQKRTSVLEPQAQSILGQAVGSELKVEEIMILNFIADLGQATCEAVMMHLADNRWHTTRMKLQRLIDGNLLISSSNNRRDRNAVFQLRPQSSMWSA